MPLGPLIAIAVYVAGGFVMFPVMVLIAATAIAFGPLLGFPTALAGCLASAAALFWVGRLGGQRWVRRFGGRFVNKVSRKLSDQGILAVAVIRVIPAAPFSVVNVVAGASHLRFTDYMIGTALGMAPGTLAFSLLGSQLERTPAGAVRHQHRGGGRDRGGGRQPGLGRQQAARPQGRRNT